MTEQMWPTPHIDACPDDFGKTVLMPGDPQRSQFVAEEYLTDARLINDVRGVKGYTGFYKGTKITVMASGIGCPSIGLYSFELFNYFDVQNIIRIGTIGSIQEYVKTRDIVLGLGASTNCNFGLQYSLPGPLAPLADYRLLKQADLEIQKLKYHCHIGNVLTCDTYYNADTSAMGKWARLGVLGIEMETAALYMNAAYCRKAALAVLTVSNNILTGEELSVEERRAGFTQMMEIALNTAVAVE